MAEITRPIRVAHVIQNLNFGGMERVLHNLARTLPGRGVEIHVVVLQYHGQFAEGLEQHATLHQVSPMGRLSMLWPTQLVTTLRGIAPDVVHSHSGVWLKAARAARQAGVPALVHTEHGRPDTIAFADRWLDRRAAGITNVIIAVSDALASTLRRQTSRCDSQVRVIINGVDVEQVRPAEDLATQRAALGLPVEATLIGSIGRLEPVKNYGLALRALAALRRMGSGAHPWLILAGDGTERASLEQQARDLGVSDRVQFLGWRTDAEQLYRAFDLFTLPSRSEGTSISLLEAMSSGVCPVVTDVGGNRAVLGSGLAQLLVPDDDAMAMASMWQRMLDAPAARANAGRQARQRVIESFSLERMVAMHESLYRELAHSTDASAGA